MQRRRGGQSPSTPQEKIKGGSLRQLRPPSALRPPFFLWRPNRHKSGYAALPPFHPPQKKRRLPFAGVLRRLRSTAFYLFFLRTLRPPPSASLHPSPPPSLSPPPHFSHLLALFPLPACLPPCTVAPSPTTLPPAAVRRVLPCAAVRCRPPPTSAAHLRRLPPPPTSAAHLRRQPPPPTS